jgi:hypothetical protein
MWKGTYPEKNADSSKECLCGREGLWKWVLQDRYIIERLNTYLTDTFPEGFWDAEEDIDDRGQPCHQLVLALAKCIESPCLLPKYIQDGIRRNIVFKRRGEWMRL